MKWLIYTLLFFLRLSTPWPRCPGRLPCLPCPIYGPASFNRSSRVFWLTNDLTRENRNYHQLLQLGFESCSRILVSPMKLRWGMKLTGSRERQIVKVDAVAVFFLRIGLSLVRLKPKLRKWKLGEIHFEGKEWSVLRVLVIKDRFHWVSGYCSETERPIEIVRNKATNMNMNMKRWQQKQ